MATWRAGQRNENTDFIKELQNERKQQVTEGAGF